VKLACVLAKDISETPSFFEGVSLKVRRRCPFFGPFLGASSQKKPKLKYFRMRKDARDFSRFDAAHASKSCASQGPLTRSVYRFHHLHAFI